MDIRGYVALVVWHFSRFKQVHGFLSVFRTRLYRVTDYDSDRDLHIGTERKEMSAWTFEQSTGKLYDPDGTYIGTGYSGGDCGRNPESVNNPDMQGTHGCTIPQGNYTRGQVIEGSHLGAFAIQLIPNPYNQMYGRAGFFMHGDNSEGNQSASEGCLIFPRSIRQEFHDSEDSMLNVVAIKIG